MKQVVIMIETDYPNADGIANVAARELFERFTPRPRFNAEVAVLTSSDGEAAKPLARHVQRGDT